MEHNRFLNYFETVNRNMKKIWDSVFETKNSYILASEIPIMKNHAINRHRIPNQMVLGFFLYMHYKTLFRAEFQSY